MELLNIKQEVFTGFLKRIKNEDYFDLMVDRKGSLANALSIHDKQLTIENGNAIVGGPF